MTNFSASAPRSVTLQPSGSPGLTPSSRLVSRPMVRTGLWPVSLARTFSAFCSFSPPSPTPMLTVTLAMRGACIGFSALVALGLDWTCLDNGLHLGLGEVALVADGERVRLDGRERLLADGQVDEVGLVA